MSFELYKLNSNLIPFKIDLTSGCSLKCSISKVFLVSIRGNWYIFFQMPFSIRFFKMVFLSEDMKTKKLKYFLVILVFFCFMGKISIQLFLRLIQLEFKGHELQSGFLGLHCLAP